MTLQEKFATLVAMLGAIVMVCVGAVLCSFVLLQREVAAPVISMATVLKELGEVKHELAREEIFLRDEEWPVQIEARTARVESAVARCMERLDRLEQVESYVSLAGSSTSRQLRGRVRAVADSLKPGGAMAGPEAAADEAAHAILLIERVAGRISESADKAREHAAVLSERLTFTLSFAMLNAALVIALVFLLLRRWVVRPVRALREATGRIADGDFQHRIEIAGRDELGQLCAELNHTAAMVAAMQEERLRQERLAATGEMVRSIAHNLRNPLSGIRSLAELTRAELDPGAEERELQTRIITTVDHFERWLARLLDMTSPLSITRAATDVGPWLGEIVESHRAAAESRSIGLTHDMSGAPGVERFDPRHLEQAVVAILSNAIEATPAGGGVEVWACESAAGEAWEIHVEDSGPGVPPGLEGRIFFPNFSTKFEGRGIGLAAAQQIVVGHGGEIEVNTDGRRRHGASFLIRLPRIAVAVAVAPEPAGVHSNGSFA